MIERKWWLRLVQPAGATILLLATLALLSGRSTALAADNLVRIEPSGINVAPGGTFTVGVIDNPSPATTAVWAIDVVFDPAVLSTTSEDCDPLKLPGGGFGAFDCQAVDTDQDGQVDTVKPLGVFLYQSGTGLNKETDLADITFHVVGEPGSCSDLHLRIRDHADSDGNETSPLVQDGRVCIKPDAPPGGTVTANPVTPRTSEPTPVGETQIPIASTGATTPGGGPQSASPAESGVTGTSNASGSVTARSSSGTASSDGGGTSVDSKGDGGGTSPLVWVAVGLVALAVVAGGAWGIIRLRAGATPGGPPPDGGAPS